MSGNRYPDEHFLNSGERVLVERLGRIAAALEKIADKVTEKVSDDKYKGSTGGLF